MKTKSVLYGAAGIVLVLMTWVTLKAVIYAHGGDANKIHACVNTLAGSIRIVGASGGCRRGETPLDWNIQGPPGQPGSPGEDGAPGGLSGHEIVTAQIVLAPLAQGEAIAECPTGKKVLGGGYEDSLVDGFAVIQISRSRPDGDNKWIVSGRSFHSLVNATLTAFAICSDEAAP